MRGRLQRRIDSLEGKRHPPKLHIVRCYGEQSQDDALDQYGRHRIGGAEDLVVVIRKPGMAPCTAAPEEQKGTGR
jgi:hypothetical protein